MVLYNGYVIDEFITADQRVTEKYEDSLLKQYFFRTIYCFIYTGYIFWGIKLKLENIKLSNVSLALWIIFQYIVGIICLAYIANIIITRV